MASGLLFVLISILFSAAAGSDCDSYWRNGIYKPSQDCRFLEYCCGTCDNRYCCYEPYNKLNEDRCFSTNIDSLTIGSAIAGVVIIIILFVACCLCPCCCLYKLCRKPTPVMVPAAHTTVISTQYSPQQPLNPAAPYPPYQPVPAQPGYSAQPGYGGQPMPPTMYQGQPYAAGPPPPYHEAGYPAPYSQAAFDGGQASYPLNPPIQQGFTHPPQPTDYSGAQPPYNPAFVEPPKTGY